MSRLTDWVSEGGFLLAIVIAGMLAGRAIAISIARKLAGRAMTRGKATRKLAVIANRADWDVSVEVDPDGRTSVLISGPWPEARPGWVHRRKFTAETTEAAVRDALAAWKGAR